MLYTVELSSALPEKKLRERHRLLQHHLQVPIHKKTFQVTLYILFIGRAGASPPSRATGDICSSYYTFWSAVADLQGRRPEGAQAPEDEAL